MRNACFEQDTQPLCDFKGLKSPWRISKEVLPEQARPHPGPHLLI
jgi:hypothetical protein